MDPHQDLQKGEFLGTWISQDGVPHEMFELVPEGHPRARSTAGDDDDDGGGGSGAGAACRSGDDDGDGGGSGAVAGFRSGDDAAYVRDYDLYVPSDDDAMDVYEDEVKDLDYGYEFDTAVGDRSDLTPLGRWRCGCMCVSTSQVAALYEAVYGPNPTFTQNYFVAVDETGELIDVEMPLVAVKRSDYIWYRQTYLY